MAQWFQFRFRFRFQFGFLFLFVGAVSLNQPFAVGQGARPGVRPSFDGIWNSATATPLERPLQLKDKAFFTPEEASAWERQAAARSQEPSPGAALRAGTGTYNTFFREFGTSIVKTLRTSIITDPRMAAFPLLRLRQPRSSAVASRESRAPRAPRIRVFRIAVWRSSRPGRRCFRIPTTATTTSSRPRMRS